MSELPAADSKSLPAAGEDGKSEGIPENAMAGVDGESVEAIVSKDKVKSLAAKERGNKQFVAKEYKDAITSYSEAILLCPDDDSENRSVYHSNRGACNLMLENWDAVVTDCTTALELKAKYPNALQRRAQAYEKQDKLQEALEDYKALLELDPKSSKGLEGVERLTPEVAKRQEKMKEEMMGKLKDLGNTILGKFGMSLDSFKATKDPSTGSYNISFGKS